MQEAIIFQDKIGESIHTSTPNGVCLLMDSSEVSNCFTYLLDPRKPAVSAKFTMRREKNFLQFFGVNSVPNI
ncbi:hypothetical protein Y032_0228g2878 [Ancylostoma ceylanicum]|nr:hypothetical protein Y032_0228g2878 [Ancylostoma ceylanicum]